MIKGIKILLAVLFVFLICNTASAQSNDIKSGIVADTAAFQVPSHIWGKIKLIRRGDRPGECEDDVVNDVCDPGTGGAGDDPVGVGGTVDTRPFKHFEGIWNVPFSDLYISFNTEGLTIIGISIDVSTFEAGFVIGTISGNTATLTRHNDSDEFNVVLEGISKNLARVTVVACSPAPSCGVFEQGTTFDLFKVF